VVGLVSALGAAQSVAIVMQVGATGDAVRNSAFGGGPTAKIVLGVLSLVFLVVAITVTTVVVTGAAEVVLTGQIRPIALRRLLGASAVDERHRTQRLVMRRAVIGMAAGVLVGYGVSVLVIEEGLSTSRLLEVRSSSLVPSPLLLIALAAQLICTFYAVRRGTQGVLEVQPIEALQLAAEPDKAVRTTLAVPARGSAITLTAGLALLVVALIGSARTPLAMLPAVFGGVVSFLGVVSYAHRFVPPLLDRLARLLPQSLAVTLARRTLMRHPVRTGRAVLGICGAVTLVATFAVGIATFQHAVHLHYDSATSSVAAAASDVLHAVVAVVLVLTLFLGVTAGVALGNAVSFGAWLRRRDTAALRILGQPARATRATILVQSLLLVATAVLVGLVLGTAYGWIGAQCVFGAEARSHVVLPVVPWPLLVGTVVAAAALTVGAAVAPVRAALRLPPIRAYLAG
jgi:putative ABC transport system permease protein